MLISRLPFGGGGGELHGANILVATAEADLIGKTVDLYIGDIIVKSGVFNAEGTMLFTGLQEVGEYNAKCEGLNGLPVVVTVDDVFNKNTLEIDIARRTELVVGDTYSLGGYDWTCAEELSGGYVLQSQGIMGGTWPAYAMSGNLVNASGNTIDVGNVNTIYNGDIDGYDISEYNIVTQNLYNLIKDAEKNANYGKGLFLISLEIGEKENYKNAHVIGANKYIMYGTRNAVSFFGNKGVSSGSACGYNYLGTLFENVNQTWTAVISPTFNIDASKIILNDHTILIR